MRTLQLAEQSDPELFREVVRHIDVYWPAYQDGHLLVDGGIGDQPARYLELMGLIRDTQAAVEKRFAAITKERASDA